MQKVVLITGAGASVPYRHPIGSELVNIIREKLENKSSALYRFLTGKGRSEEMARMKYNLPSIHPDTIEDFRKNFIMSASYSIDEFSSLNFSKYGKIGKMCVAFVLRECEEFEYLYPPGTQASLQKQDWIKLLFNLHFGHVLDPDSIENLTYITFNYDRVFEKKLYDFVSARHSSMTQEEWNKVSALRIHHIYGSLGPPEWDLSNKREPWNDFGFKKEDNYCEFQVQASARDIRVYTEENQRDAPIPEHFYDHIYNAEKIYFLGFGFNETNVKRLGIDWKKVRGCIYATLYGVNDSKEILDLCSKYEIDTSNFKKVHCVDLINTSWKEEVTLKQPFDARKNKSSSRKTRGKTIVKQFEDGDRNPEW